MTVKEINNDLLRIYEVILELTPYTYTKNIIPVFWTYHPNFMNYHNLDEHIKNLIEKITNATN